MNEDEAWEDLERRSRERMVQQYIAKAQGAAQTFIDQTPSKDLARLTLAQAYELGYRHGHTNAKNT